MKLAIVKNHGDTFSEVSIYFTNEFGELYPVDHTRVKGRGHVASSSAAKLIEERFRLECEYVKNDFDEAVLILR